MLGRRRVLSCSSPCLLFVPLSRPCLKRHKNGMKHGSAGYIVLYSSRKGGWGRREVLGSWQCGMSFLPRWWLGKAFPALGHSSPSLPVPSCPVRGGSISSSPPMCGSEREVATAMLSQLPAGPKSEMEKRAKKVEVHLGRLCGGRIVREGTGKDEGEEGREGRREARRPKLLMVGGGKAWSSEGARPSTPLHCLLLLTLSLLV